PCLRFDQKKITCYMPLIELQSAEMDRALVGDNSCRARLALRNGMKVAGTLAGQLGGRCEFGRISIPWTAVKTLSVTFVHRREDASLAIPSKGELALQDGSRLRFTSWAPVLGDVILDVLLTEGARGPRMLPLAESGTLELAGQDRNEFFWRFFIHSK